MCILDSGFYNPDECFIMVVALVYILGQVPRRLGWVFVCMLGIAHILLVVFQGQITLFAVVCMGIAYWMYAQSRDVMAGVLLVFATIKPELVLLPTIALVVMAIWERRWKLPVTFLLALLLTLALSFVVAGFWVPSWLAQVRVYRGYAKSVWPIGVLYQYKLVSALACLVLIGLASKVTQWDRDFIFAAAERNKISRNPFHPFSIFDTVSLSGLAYGQTVLSRAAQAAGLEWDSKEAHSALYDASQTAKLFCTIVNRWSETSGPVWSDENN